MVISYFPEDERKRSMPETEHGGNAVKLHLLYLQLLDHFEGARVAETTLRELAGVWSCTVRNAALVIGRMEALGWVRRQAERGRGRRSVMAFLAAEDEIAGDIIARAASGKDLLKLLKALEGLGSAASGSGVRVRLEAELLSRLGFRRETAGNRRIDILRLPIRQAPRTFDPMEMNLLTESFIAGHVYDSLLRLEKGRPAAHLAHAWDAGPDGTVWTFRLRKGVFFHHGKELDSRDAAWTLGRLREAPAGTLYRMLFRKMRRIHVRDERTVVIELESPLAFLPELLATGRAAVLPADLGARDPGRFRRRPVGTGPFKLSAAGDRMLELEAFRDYFRERPHLDKVEIWVLPEEDEGVFGGADGRLFRIIHNPRETPEAGPGFRLVGSGVTVSKFLTVNTRKAGPLSDPARRAAVLDRLSGPPDAGASPAAGPGGPDGGPADGTARNPGAAAFEALRLITIHPYRKDAEAIALALGRSGIPVRVEPVPPEAFTGGRRLEADLLFFTLIRDREALLRQYDLFLAMADHLDDRSASAVRTALSVLDREADPAERKRLMADLERRLIRDRLLVIWQERSARMAVHESVRDAVAESQGWVDLRGVWFE